MPCEIQIRPFMAGMHALTHSLVILHAPCMFIMNLLLEMAAFTHHGASTKSARLSSLFPVIYQGKHLHHGCPPESGPESHVPLQGCLQGLVHHGMCTGTWKLQLRAGPESRTHLQCWTFKIFKSQLHSCRASKAKADQYPAHA